MAIEESPGAEAKRDTRPVQRLSKESQKALVEYVKNILLRNKNNEELYSKMEAIDKAYARYKYIQEGNEFPNGVDAAAREGNTNCCNIFGNDDIIAPIVVAQVDAMVAYLSEVFLSGLPIFPVVSRPRDRKLAEKLEVLIDDHAQLGGYVRQLLLHFKDAVKYNLGAIECPWEEIEQFSVLGDFMAEGGQSIKRDPKYFTAINRLDMYNTFWDKTVAPADVALKGDFAGFVDVMSKTALKRHCNKLKRKRVLYNEITCLRSGGGGSGSNASVVPNFRVHPTISDRISARTPQGENFNWSAWLGMDTKGATKLNLADGSLYERIRVYVRIAPDDFNITAPQQRTPQIWRLEIINGEHLLSAERIISAYDALPILFAQPMEDGFGLQAKSLAEGAIPFQEAATTLFNIRFQAARRAVSDRALFDPDLISADDVNNPTAAPKIPVRMKTLVNKGLADAYYPIPFDLRGTETAINDASVIVGFSERLSGINGPQQGMFQKGNKSVKEWDDTVGNADNRLRIPAMLLEAQVFFLLKQILALNIFQFGENAKVVSQKNGEIIDIDIAELRKAVLAFKVADGYTPKAKIASTEMLTLGMNMLMNSPLLQQTYGAMLPAMFAHMMSLGGVRDLEQYAPEQTPGEGTSVIGNPLANLDAASLQQAQLESGAAPQTSQAAPPAALT